jgi:hypothetical protein
MEGNAKDLMAEGPRISNPLHLISTMQASEELAHRDVTQKELEPGLRMLRSWQSMRLGNTYADLLEDKRFSAACSFFLSDVYGPRDFSQRDHDIEHLYDWLSRLLPAQMLRLLSSSIALNQMSNTLDHELLQILKGELDVKDTVSAELYAEAYRRCDNYELRRDQINLMAQVLKEVSEGARFPLVGITLKAFRKPAQQAGWDELYDFLSRGYEAFKPVRDSGYFVRTIQKREMTILDQIFDGHPDPFTIS